MIPSLIAALRPWRLPSAGAGGLARGCLAAGEVVVEQILRQDQQGDPHQGQGLAALLHGSAFNRARDLEVLGPGQAHGDPKEIMITILGKADHWGALYNLKHWQWRRSMRWRPGEWRKRDGTLAAH